VQNRLTCSSLCETITIVVFISISVFSMLRVVSLSQLDVDSSRSNKSGSKESAIAKLARCASPPERDPHD